MRIFTIIVLLGFGQFIHAQDRAIRIDHTEYEALYIDTVFHVPRFVKFSESRRPEIAHWERVLQNIYKSGIHTDWRIVRKETDQLDMEHLFVQQLHDHIPVEGAIMGIHGIHGKIVSISGTFIPLNDEIKDPVLSPEQAIKEALRNYPSEGYKWQIPQEENWLKESSGNPQATWYPQPVRVIVSSNFEIRPLNFFQAYKLKIYSEIPLLAKQVFVDAENGKIIAEEDLIHIMNKPATAITHYSDTQSMVTDSFSGGYRLREIGRGNGIETFNMKKGSSYAGAVDFTDADNFWDNVNASKDEIATDAHWGAEMTYDYFFHKFGRNSYDNKGAKIRSYVHYGNNYNNAFWNGSVMTYGDGDGSVFTPLTSMDVCGHEVSHAVTTNTAGLVYSYESGALNESFSDIFGNSIEKYAKPNDFNWRLGEEITPSGTGIRHMGNPNAKGHPDTYKGTLWYSGTGDNGGVHTNSGVQNYWYYLLCEGGIGKNDKSDSFFVDSIGMEKAEQIAYRNLAFYLTPNSQYADARFFSIQSAIDLYGNCSPEVIATTNAWHAVGVGQKYDSGSIQVDFKVDTFFCRAPVFVPFSNLSINTNQYKWDFGDGQTSVSHHPVHQYLQQGTYTVSLEGQGCFANIKDTLIRQNVIVIDSTPDICNAVIMPKGSWQTVSFCAGYIYDNGGEGKYAHLIRDTLTIAPAFCDSISLKFLDFEYENKFDSIYIYDGPTPASPKLGGYTGSSLPKGGLPIISSGKSLTLIHFSDPLANGRGFKAEVKTYTKPVSLTAMPDSTVCYNQSIQLYVNASGGATREYLYLWNGQMKHDSFLNISLKKDSIFEIEMVETCSNQRDTAIIRIKVRNPLQLTLSKDTTICFGTQTKLWARANGGNLSSYQYQWNGQINSDSLNYAGLKDSIFEVILSDQCTPISDTAWVKVLVMSPLSADLSTDTIICAGNSTGIMAKVKGGNGSYTYAWSNGLGGGASHTVSPAFHSTYTVNISDGCTQPSISDSVRIYVRSALTMQLPSDTQLCRGQALMIKPIVSGGDTLNRSLIWNQSLYQDSARILPQNDTLIIVKLKDDCSAIEPSDSVMIRVLMPLSVSLPGDDTLCVGQSKLLTTLASGGLISGYKYVWDPAVGVGSSVLVNPVVTTNYQVILSDGCTLKNDTASVRIFVRTPLSVLATGDKVICQGDTVRLSAQGSGGFLQSRNYSWAPSGLNSQTPDVSPLSSTLYIVTFNDGCSDYAIDSVWVTVKSSPKIDFYVQSSPACSGEPLIFNNLTTSTSADVFKWSFGDGTFANVRQPVHTYSSGGWYRIELEATNDQGCTKVKGFDSLVEIVPMPIPAFAMNGNVIPYDQPILNLTNLSLNATHYTWFFGDGNSSTDKDPTYQYSDSGHLVVKLTAFNRIGCDSSVEQNLWIKPSIYFHLPNAFTPADVNGANDIFKPVFSAIVSFKMLIFNRWGEIIFESDHPSKGWNGKDRDGEIYPQGNYQYFIHVIDIDNVSQTYKGNVLLIR